eukprot:TRINITY_DN76549_c0_g1_i1.p1 TRINITY_DN76549_c0_g1~~TRINITY_DN76549_c0_g1_i1.p1  ORF type:complete len:642 (+),score=362.93 TRINITY_DN76549_c0_g1_i1:49-1974(+)
MAWYYWVAGVLSVVTYLGFIRYHPRDWRYIYKGAKMMRDLVTTSKKNRTFTVMWRERLEAERKQAGSENRPALVFEEKIYTYNDLERGSNQLAHWALSQNVAKDDTVALFMTNRPRYVMFWIGIAKVGGATALINHNLRRQQLVHSIKVSQARVVVFGPEKRESIAEVRHELDDLGVRLFCLGEDGLHGEDERQCEGLAELICEELHTFTTNPVAHQFSAEARGVRVKDPFLYVYTSGTTGMPKASLINHLRFRIAGRGWAIFFNVTPKDTVYCALPLYHSAGGLIGVGLMIIAGSTMVLRRKFSASAFWKDVRRYNCTIVQYIGELCRYVLAVPPSPEDGNNRVRLAVGNGLRPEIWGEFKRRFNIGQIGEFYAATEGAGGLINTEDREGSIGFLPPLADMFIPLAIVKFNHETEQLVRDPRTGFCVRADADEPGEFLAQIRDIGGTSNYSGYKNRQASNKKIAHDVFKKGDRWFRSGDLIRKDSEGFCYFVDRIGDTFRWKGENCSTAEIAKVLASFSRSTGEPNVYGVQVPGQDGRAGMVAFANPSETGRLRSDDIDLRGLAAYVKQELPVYARPVFLRILSAKMETTGTFKHRKLNLRNEGFDPSQIDDELFFFNGDEYVPLTRQLYDDIVHGRVRL